MKTEFINQVLRIVLIVGAGAVLFAQGSRPTSDGYAHDTLVAEVQALRAEVHQIAGAGIRTHLLVMRLQLQEQRVLMAGRQLLDVQSALANVRQTIAGEQSRIDQLEKSVPRFGPQGQDQIQQVILDAKAQAEQLRRKELELQAREREFLKAVNDAQVQWTDLSERLDALERSLPAGVSP